MSTSVPIAVPSIPMPDATPESNYNAILAIKQNIEIAQGTRGTAFSARLHGPTPTEIAIKSALTRLTP